MTCLTTTAFWCTAIGVSLLFFSWLAPFWLSHHEGRVANHYQGLWYRAICKQLSCDFGQVIMNNDNIPLIGPTWNVEIIVVPVLTTIALVFGVCAMALLELLTCKCSRKALTWKARKILLACILLLAFTGVLGLISMFISYYIADEYYTDHKNSFVFPWCLLLLTLAVILIIVGAILYAIITYKWDIYRDHYESWGYNLDKVDAVPIQTLRTRDTSSFKRSVREPPISNGVGSYNNPVLGRSNTYAGSLSSSAYNLNSSALRKSGSGYGGQSALASPLSRSLYGNSRSAYGASKMKDDTYFDFRGSDLRFSKSHSNLNLNSSRRSLNDSPSILRRTNVTEYMKDDDDYLGRLRSSKRSEEVIDPLRLSSGRTLYREANEGAFSGFSISESRSSTGLRSAASEPTVLDILYRESKRNNDF
ncbi:uncharacterized protein LOC128225051 [Mya arenaria]|uniref:uncharacterized protein LOC128225051 n=1 Tax=Mya arenaria TaxID=6604 RepID=UPI0022E7E34C|nr:uncharacterized protein LOC128225051 [Mya arenaria]